MLRWLVVVNLVASASHFGHNAIFFDSYPLPEWIRGPWVVVIAWLVAATLLLLGYRRLRVGAARSAAVLVFVYCVASWLGLAHYLYGPPGELSVAANSFIVFEGVAASALALFVLSGLRGRVGAPFGPR